MSTHVVGVWSRGPCSEGSQEEQVPVERPPLIDQLWDAQNLAAAQVALDSPALGLARVPASLARVLPSEVTEAVEVEHVLNPC